MLKEKEAKLGLPSIGIPAEVLFNPKLTSTEKMLFGFLRNLSQTEKGCWASNKYLAALFFGISPQTISNAVSKLKEYHYIKVKYVKRRKLTVGIINYRHIHINYDYKKLYRPLVEQGHKILFEQEFEDVEEKITKSEETLKKTGKNIYKKIYICPIIKNLEDIVENLKMLYINFLSKEDIEDDIYKSFSKEKESFGETLSSTSFKKNKVRDILPKQSKKVQSLFQLWQDQEVTKHKISKTRNQGIKKLKSYLKKYSYSDIEHSIKAYGKLYNTKNSILFKRKYPYKVSLLEFFGFDDSARTDPNSYDRMEHVESWFKECLKEDLSHFMLLGKNPYPEVSKKLKKQFIKKIKPVKNTPQNENTFRKASRLLMEFHEEYKDQLTHQQQKYPTILADWLIDFIDSIPTKTRNGKHPGWLCSDNIWEDFPIWMDKNKHWNEIDNSPLREVY